MMRSYPNFSKTTIFQRFFPHLLLSIFVLALTSCATYRQSMDKYYSAVETGNYRQAEKILDKNKLLSKNRNKLLYNLEAGKLQRLAGNYVASNRYFNIADNMMDWNRNSAGDLILGNLLNPMMQSYTSEDYEVFMVHYYKALNYISLGKTDDAVVEARRITLSNDRQKDKFGYKSNRYSNDAFALNLQGMIYEMSGDINNAFISYRNASEVYKDAQSSYYGVQMPQQLMRDYARTSKIMGFSMQPSFFTSVSEKKLNEADTSGALIIFLEEGRAPIKEEQNFMLTTSDGGSNFSYTDQHGYSNSFPFSFSSYGLDGSKLSSVRATRVAMPVYKLESARSFSKSILVNDQVFEPELVENINSVATSLLKERFGSELARALARQLAKKLTEKGVSAIVESTAKKDDTKPEATEEEKKKNEQQQKNAKIGGEIAGLLVNLVGTIAEKADTRNWQSLPAFISYVRVPLHAGKNIVKVVSNGVEKQMTIEGGLGLQMMLVSF